MLCWLGVAERTGKSKTRVLLGKGREGGECMGTVTVTVISAWGFDNIVDWFL